MLAWMQIERTSQHISRRHESGFCEVFHSIGSHLCILHHAGEVVRFELLARRVCCLFLTDAAIIHGLKRVLQLI